MRCALQGRYRQQVAMLIPLPRRKAKPGAEEGA
jgi:hypothetical protein